MNTNQITSFLTHHWLLTLVLLILLLLIVSYDHIFTDGKKSRATPQEVIYLTNRDTAIVIDLRQSAMFAKSHIINAINIPADQLNQSINKLQRYKDKHLILIPAQPRQTVQARKTLKSTFPNATIKVLSGGMTAWHQAGLPVKRKS